MEKQIDKQICILGTSGTGKTCYIYALAQVMQMGVEDGNVTISAISNNAAQQGKINRLIGEMLEERKWPKGTAKKETEKDSDSIYDFCLRVQTDNVYKEIIPSLKIKDYAGGVLEHQTHDSKNDYDKIIQSFKDSVTLIFLVDAQNVLQGIDESDLAEEHRGVYGNHNDKRLAINAVTYIESILRDFKKENGLPPVMVAITKSDLFCNDNEREAAMKFIRKYIPSFFAIGSTVDAGICCVSLGENLGTDDSGLISGELKIDTSNNLHLPFLFGVYNYLDSVYDGSTPQNQAIMSEMFRAMSKMFDGKLQVFESGKPAFFVE